MVYAGSVEGAGRHGVAENNFSFNKLPEVLKP